MSGLILHNNGLFYVSTKLCSGTYQYNVPDWYATGLGAVLCHIIYERCWYEVIPTGIGQYDGARCLAPHKHRNTIYKHILISHMFKTFIHIQWGQWVKQNLETGRLRIYWSLLKLMFYVWNPYPAGRRRSKLFDFFHELASFFSLAHQFLLWWEHTWISIQFNDTVLPGILILKISRILQWESLYLERQSLYWNKA